tara:strand:+ start:3981 stop:6119 length:2139 start_codon:yes stop_codon:yes gene_type:complete
MAQTQVEIEVELSGAGKVDKGIQKIEGGLEGIGETGSRLAKAMGSTNEKLGEGLENVSGTVGEVREAFSSLGSSITNLGQTGAKGFMSLLGPLGMLVGAGIAVYETFRQISGAAQEAQEAEEAMNAASSDLQQKLESLAEKGIIPTTKELEKFSLAVIESQLAKETFEKALTKYRKSFEKITLAKKQAADATRDEAKAEEIGGAVYVENVLKRQAADRNLIKARRESTKVLKNFQAVQRETLKEIMAAGEQEQEFEKRSTDSLKAEAKKLANLQKELALLKARQLAKGDELYIADEEYTQKVRLLNLEEQLENANHEQVESILIGLKLNGRVKAEQVEKLRFQQKQIEIIKKEGEEQKKLNETRRKDFEARQKQQEQEYKKDLVLTSQINQAKIKLKFEGDQQILKLEEERHRATLELTKAGSKERELEELRHQFAMQSIKQNRLKENKRKEDERLQILQESNERELNLRYDLARRLLEIEQESSGFGTDMESLTFESEQRLKILELEFQREINLARMKGQEITEIQRRFAVERIAITKESTRDQADLLSEYFAEYSEGFAQAGFNALFFGESFQEATAQVLKSLAQQAVSQSVMKAAEGFGLLAMGLPGSAAAFKSSALFASAAAIAGVASNALGGGGGGTAQSGTSPTGQPSTAPTPEREERTTDSMVFNINFGGAVVYDTKKAAEQAFADRLVSIINTPRRGAVQFNRR